MHEQLIEKLNNNPENWELRRDVIKHFIENSNKEQAQEILNQATDFPTYGDSLIAASECYKLLDPNYGLEILDMVIQSDVNNASAYVEKAKILLELKKIDLASESYKQGKEIDQSLTNLTLEKDLGIISKHNLPKPNIPKSPKKNPNVEPVIKENIDTHTPTEESPQPRELDGVVYPSPGAFPTIPASEVVKVAPLIDPSALPDKEQLSYDTDINYLNTVYSTPEELEEDRKNVYVKIEEEEVLMDYDNPDSVIPQRDDDALSVVAQTDVNGEKIAPLPKSLLDYEYKRKQDKIRKKQGRIKALVITLGIHIVLALSFLAIRWALPEPPLPTITAFAPTTEVAEEIKPDVVEEMQSQTESVPMPDMISANSTSDFSIPDIETETDFEPLVTMPTFDTPTAAQASTPVIFGVPIEGKLGVIFDVSTSTAMYLPSVLKEIEKGFKDAPTIAVENAGFKKFDKMGVVRFRRASQKNSKVFKYWKNKKNRLHLFHQIKGLLRKSNNAYTDGPGAKNSDMSLGVKFLLKRRDVDNIYIFSDLQDKCDLKTIKEITKEVLRKKVKIYVHLLGEKIEGNHHTPEIIKAITDMVEKSGGQIFLFKAPNKGGDKGSKNKL